MGVILTLNQFFTVLHFTNLFDEQFYKKNIFRRLASS